MSGDSEISRTYKSAEAGMTGFVPPSYSLEKMLENPNGKLELSFGVGATHQSVFLADAQARIIAGLAQARDWQGGEDGAYIGLAGRLALGLRLPLPFLESTSIYPSVVAEAETTTGINRALDLTGGAALRFGPAVHTYINLTDGCDKSASVPPPGEAPPPKKGACLQLVLSAVTYVADTDSSLNPDALALRTALQW